MKKLQDLFRTDPDFQFRIGLLALVLAAVILYSPILAGKVPFPADVFGYLPQWDAQTKSCCAGVRHAEQGDLVTAIYPWRSALGHSLRSGVIPLWNPQMLMGTPFLADPQYAVFYPLNWLYAILSPSALALAAIAIARTAIMAVTMAIFVRRLGSSNAGALISGFTLALSGWFVAWGGWPLVDSAMWLPLMFLSIDWLAQTLSLKAIALTALSFALPVLAGHPEVAFQVILTAASYAVYRFFPLSTRSIRYLGSFIAASLVSVMLAAVQLFPTLQWLTQISRAFRFFGAFPLRYILALVSRDLFRNLNVDQLPIPNGAAYAGAIALAALPFVWLWPKRRDVIYFVSLVAACLGIVYGIDPFYWISIHVPVLQGLPNSRFLCVVDFGLAVLTGFGVSALEARCRNSRSGWIAAVFALPALAACCRLIYIRLAGGVSIPFRFNLLVIGAALCLTLLAFTRRISSSHLLLSSAFLLAADLGTFAFGTTPFVRPSAVFPPNASFDYLREKADSTWRIASVDVTYPTNFEVPYGLYSAGGYDFPLRRTTDLLSVFSNHPTIISFLSAKMLSGPAGLLDLTGTRFFVATDWNDGAHALAAHPERFRQVFKKDRIFVFEYPSALPLAFLEPSTRARVVAAEDEQRKLVLARDFDPRQTVIVPAAIARFDGHPSPPQAPRVRMASRNSNTMNFEATTEQPSLLVVNEAFYPDWSAKVDGESAQVIRTNYAFMSVPLATGTHTVQLAFTPASFRLGGALSLLGTLLCAVLFFVPQSRPRT